jgi:hypothetical protein
LTAQSEVAVEVLDARGLKCPMPVVRTAQRMQAMNPGQMLEVRRGEGPRSKGSQGQLPGSRDVLLRDRRRQKDAAALRLRPSAHVPKPNRLWYLGKVVFNKSYWHSVPRARS